MSKTSVENDPSSLLVKVFHQAFQEREVGTWQFSNHPADVDDFGLQIKLLLSYEFTLARITEKCQKGSAPEMSRISV